MKKLIYLFTLLLLLASTVFAESAYDSNPFDNQVATLPVNYNGYDIKQLYDELKQMFPPKDEFETKDTYLGRLYTNKINNIYAFKIEHSYSYYSEYNADQEILLIKLVFSNAQKLDRATMKITSYKTLRLKRIEKEVTQYTASNVYGKEVIVTKQSGSEYGISLLNDNNLSINKLNTYLIPVKIEPDKAKELKANLGILLLCNLGASKTALSYTLDDYLYIKPTVNNPRESSYEQFFCFVNINEIWIYNYLTGEVIQKIKVKK